MVVGVLSLQGGVTEHISMLEGLGASVRRVRRNQDFEGLTALVIPGGESTTLNKLLDVFEMRDSLQQCASSVPTLGTCAGLILLSQLGVLDVDVERNAFGPQADSAEACLPWREGTVEAAFIRAPAVTRVGESVEVLATFDDRIVGVRQGNIWGISFHPEVTGDATVHKELLTAVESH